MGRDIVNLFPPLRAFVVCYRVNFTFTFTDIVTKDTFTKLCA